MMPLAFEAKSTVRLAFLNCRFFLYFRVMCYIIYVMLCFDPIVVMLLISTESQDIMVVYIKPAFFSIFKKNQIMD